MPSHRDSEEPIRDTLARLETGLAAALAGLAELGSQLADLSRRLTDAEGEAEEILRRAAAPSPSRTGDRFLKSVKAFAFALVGLGIVLAAMAPVRAHQLRYSPRCVTACARPVVHQAPRPATAP